MANRNFNGREQRRNTPGARSHTPDLRRFYHYRRPPITPGAFTFHLDLLRPRRPAFSLDRMVDTFGWDDEQAVMTGSLVAHRPDPADPRTLPIGRGDLVRCRVRWEHGLYELWTMRVEAPQAQVDQGVVNVTLKDDMALLEGHKRDWIFRKTKRRPFGWTAGEATRELARLIGMKVGEIAPSSHRFTLVKRKATALATLRAIWALDKKHSARTFIIRRRNGRLEVVTLRRNPMLYVLGHQIQTALITQKAGLKVPTTVLTGRGRIGHGKHTRKVVFTAYDRRVVSLLGYVHDTEDFGAVESHRELRDLTKRELAKRLRLNDTITIQHQGIPFILRGDGVEVNLPSEGYKGKQAFVYATRANHTVQAGVYTTEWDFTAADPYLGKLGAFERASQHRAAKRTARKRTRLKG